MIMQIPYSKVWITRTDLAAVQKVLVSGFVSQGSVTRQFEDELCQKVGVEQGGAVAVGSGIAALVIALWALDIGPGDEVIIPSYICREVTEAVLITGARPVFCDVGEQWVVTVENIKSRIGSLTRAAIIPHLFGIYANTIDFLALNIPIIEDCSQAFGLAPNWRINGDIATFSFRWSKCITTGEGGMAVSRDPKLIQKMRYLRDGTDSPHRRIGAPLSDVSSALGLSQLKRYSTFLKRRSHIANKYKYYLDQIDASLLSDVPYDRSMFYRMPIKVPGGWMVHQSAFWKRGIMVDPGIPVLQHTYFQEPDDDFPSSIALLDQTIVLPIYPAMLLKEEEYCLDAIHEVLQPIFAKH